MSKRLKRFHRSVYFPAWSDESLLEYFKEVTGIGPLKFSLHALEKLSESVLEHGRAFLKAFLRIIRRNSLTLEGVFEFYAVDTVVKKACFRYALPDFPVDLVLVISADGVVITVFVVNKGDDHSTLDEKLYERNA